jgi:hypothetical protein
MNQFFREFLVKMAAISLALAERRFIIIESYASGTVTVREELMEHLPRGRRSCQWICI